MILAIGILAVLAMLINIGYSYYERLESFFWNWPAYGLIAVGMFLNHAYANALMQVMQAGISTYGFFNWSRLRKQSLKETLLSMVYDRKYKDHAHPVIATTRMTLVQHSYALLGGVGVFLLLRWILNFVNDLSPTVDALSFSIYLLAVIQYNHKKIETWIYYFIADIFSGVLAYQAHNWFNVTTMVLMALLCVVCFKRWYRCERKAKCLSKNAYH